MKLSHLLLPAALLMAATSPLSAQDWQFGPAIDVTKAQGEGIYHHLESAGRRNIAVAGDTLAIAWEDDRSGVPAIYLARKPLQADGFGDELKISGDGEAYEPSLIAVDNQRFALAWEEEGRVYARLVEAERLGPITLLSDTEAAQVSLARSENGLIAALAARPQRKTQIRVLRLNITAQLGLSVEQNCPLEKSPAKQDQLYPVALQQSEQTVVTWEDRRPGHTIIMASQGSLDGCTFSKPQRISEDPGGPPAPFGKGHGVTRVALTAFGEQGLFAAWADKRNFREGYQIFGGYLKNGKLDGHNVRVQDEFGEIARQWHASVSGRRDGSLITVWSDEREGSSDIALSVFGEDGWSEDVMIPGASGPGEQAHPSVILDDQGNLHLAWIERDKPGASTRLKYLFGRAE